jgi:phage terminase large subunit
MQPTLTLDRAGALTAAYELGHYDLLGLNPKQQEAIAILADTTTKALLFGGGANGGKSWLGCTWLLFSCLAYPGTRWFIGREELKRLRDSTYLTFGKVRQAYGLPLDTYKYNGQDHNIQFPNGSRIDLLELKFLPSDALYERYGSVEFTGGWIEEGGEVDFGAYDTLKSRVGRQLNDKYGLLGKLLITCNPKKNWLYTTFFKPFKDNILKPSLRFLQSLVGDNLKRESGAIEALQELTDQSKRERLLLGNWEYEDDPTVLMEYDSLLALFTNEHVLSGPKRYLTGDIARFGADKTVLLVWQGWRVVQVLELTKYSTAQVAQEIRKLCQQWQVPLSNCVVDEDGVGGGVRDQLPGCKGFVNNARPIKMAGQNQNYENLKTQCYYRLAELRVNPKALYLTGFSPGQQQALTEELGQIKSKDADKDGVLRIQPKDVQKLALGRSPDYADALMMREYFELASTYTGF